MMKMFHAAVLSFLITGISVSAQGVAIHPSGDTTKCLEVRNGSINSATAVQIYDCDGSASQKWVINRGSTIQLAGTNFCLDSLWRDPDVGTLIWECDSRRPEHQWDFTSNGNIKHPNSNICLNVPYGTTQNGVQVETQICGNGQSDIWQV